MAHKVYYVHNGSYVQHAGTRESCEQYIKNVKDLFDISGLTICVHVNGRYRPAIFVR